jgi:hypothetical protein
LLISKLTIPKNWQKSKATAQPGEEVFKIHLFEDLNIRYLFQNRSCRSFREKKEKTKQMWSPFLVQ